MAELDTLINLATDSYLEVDGVPTVRSYGSYAPTSTNPEINSNTGFRAQAHYSTQEKTLIITFTGTNDDKDNVSNHYVAGIKSGDYAEQTPEAISFARSQIDEIKEKHGNNFDIVFNGHSLGGYLATVTLHELDVGTATAFNAPGVGAGPFSEGFQDDRVTYVYSNPTEWDETLEVIVGYGLDSSDIHNTGEHVSGNIFFFMGAEGHSIESIKNAANSGDRLLTRDEVVEIAAEEIMNLPSDLTGRQRSIEMNRIFKKYDFDGIGAKAILDTAECFLPGTPIDMWPTSLALKPDALGRYDEKTVLANVWQKPIEEVSPDDWVVSFDKDGNLQPGKVTRTFTNEAKIVLDFFGTGVTPGHVYYRADSIKPHKYEPLIDILRDDGVIERSDGTQLRAATGVPLGDAGDGFVWAITGHRTPEGGVTVQSKGKLRLGTRLITDDGRDLCIADLIRAGGGTVTPDGLIQVAGSEAALPFHWAFGDALPAPEDYILKRSGTTLADIYKAGEWEGQRPQMPAPMVRDGGPVQPLSPEGLAAMPRNTPLAAQDESYASSPRPVLNRKHRKALAAKQRKAKPRKPVLH